MLVRAQPFKDMLYHDKTRTDFIMWRTRYCTIADEDLDLTKPEHVAQVGYSRVVLLFQCAIAANSNTDHQIMDLAFIEELWCYSPLKDQLDSEYGCTLLYPVVTCGYLLRHSSQQDPGPLRHLPQQRSSPHPTRWSTRMQSRKSLRARRYRT